MKLSMAIAVEIINIFSSAVASIGKLIL